jgi:hypothetical protein
MNTESVDLQTADLMTAISNNLNKRFFKAPKNKAKQQYQALESGEEIPFMDISVQGQDDISCRLGLDHSQFVGGLSFTRFRDALASHLERVGIQLRSKVDLNVYTAKDSHDVIINIPGFVQAGDTLNILVTGIEQPHAGSIIVRLMFLDPALFKKA